MNVIEIDAASNNGVDNIREIREEVTYRPTQGKYKVYIIDEVHMLSAGAFNALLKTLEEPPSYVIFILATTESHKIPVTIQSRCQRYDFHRISIDTIAGRLRELMEKEQVDAEEKAEAIEKGKVFLLGTDGLGRDLLSYLIYGARTSVILCIACTILSTIISTIIGVSSAVLGGGYDLLIQRLVDAWQCIPSMLILLILMVLLGNGMPQMIIAISVPGGIAGSRIIRSAAMSVKDAGYVKMSQMLGSNALWEMVKHVLPNIMPIIIINMAGSLGGVVMMEASMNFLGYGVNVGTPSWGYLITNQGRDFMLIHPLLAIAPGVLIALMVFSSAMFGDGVRDILDPRLKGGVGSYSTKKLRRAAERLSRQKAAAE